MFIQVIQGHVADPEAAHAALDRWDRELAPGSHGWLGTTAGVTDDGTLVAMARFESEEEARRNSERMEQTRWWQDTAKVFDGKVTFHDCPDVVLYQGGGSDAAGFVQIIQGHVSDKDRMRMMMRDTESELATYRPDLIGGESAVDSGGDYTEAAFFTSEDEARQGERRDLPPELRQKFEQYMGLFESGPAYYDLHHPWMYSPHN
ncbi:hypothetical protein ACIBHX_28965 [Nonomuraea sp. NPDC050536]|uniref:hypothetical protein n=1 Tax=Nonomuraea sp. NPDC050536 TaxID=3364366 RepID=UPI0037C5D9E4